jgi:hypothetical protein
MPRHLTIGLLGAAFAAACGGGTPSGGPDGGAVDAAPDADVPIEYPACDEFRDPELSVSEVPLALAGDLAGAGADMESPADCDVVDAPFGMESLGADIVIQVDGLQIGTDYAVRLDADDDLQFYVASACGTETGPATRDCQLFVDAETDQAEVGRFTAEFAREYIVVDYFSAGYPDATNFLVQVYEATCETSAECGGTTPICQDYRCSGCASDFDCTDPALPLCDEASYTCVSGTAACIGDDVHENGDDGPAGATLLTPGTPIGGQICDSPSGERDFYRFHVSTPGENWFLQLDWAAALDLDIEAYDAAGNLLGLSFYEQPEGIELTYLPVGDYYVLVDYYSQNGTPNSTGYTLSASRTFGSCIDESDCAAEFRNQVFRGTCNNGACERIDGDGALPAGARCDSTSDCGAGTDCASFFFTQDADTRMTCGTLCDTTPECAAMGANYICTDYLVDNFCVQKCTSDLQCPAVPYSYPTTLPWKRFSCQVATGRCIPPP